MTSTGDFVSLTRLAWLAGNSTKVVSLVGHDHSTPASGVTVDMLANLQLCSIAVSNWHLAGWYLVAGTSPAEPQGGLEESNQLDRGEQE